MTLADTEDDLRVHGRIGYGNKSPWILGAIVILVVLAIGLANLLDNNDSDANGPDAAPDFTMALFDGGTFRLADHSGHVVVVNFWASWCEPCRAEMPALQSAADEAGDDVVFVGVGAKTDREDEARAFAEEFGITYPIGRDTEGGDRVNGAIQVAYGIFAFPSTIIVDPEGNIAAILITPFDDPADLLPYIDAARGVILASRASCPAIVQTILSVHERLGVWSRTATRMEGIFAAVPSQASLISYPLSMDRLGDVPENEHITVR